MESAPDTHQPEELLQGRILKLLQESLGFFFFNFNICINFIIQRYWNKEQTFPPNCTTYVHVEVHPATELPTTTLIQPELRSTDRTTAAGGHSRGLCFTAKRMGLESVKRKSHLQLLLEHSPCWFGRRSSRRRWFLCRSKE